jgi:hypothetical protein
MSNRTVNLSELIDFYDKRIPTSIGHASAINAVMGEDLAIALLCDYFNRGGGSARLIDKRCTQGTQKGKRLDAWIEISNADGTYHYQTEIKNWSAHAIGGKTMPSNPTPQAMINYRINRWRNQFSDEKRTLKEEAARKVLTPMLQQSADWKVRPLIVFWDAMNPTGDAIEFFSTEIDSGEFQRLWVFSMSTYVRNLLDDGIAQLDLKMPETIERLAWFERFFAAKT